LISLGLPFLASVPFFSEWLSLTFKGRVMILALQRSLPGGWLGEDGGRGGGGRKGSRHVVLCGAGLPPLLAKSLLGGGSFGPSKTMTVTATTGGLKRARSMCQCSLAGATTSRQWGGDYAHWLA